jgi:uncharacterized membrane protein YhaH (DUF805 family)
VVEFERNEIDLRRTLSDAGNKPRRARRAKPAGVAASLPGAATPANATVASPVPATPPAAAAAPAVRPVPPPTPQPAPAAKETAQPEPAQPAPADPSSPPDKAELERRGKQAAEMMAEAVQKQDPELMKKAIETQGSALPQNDVRAAGRSGRYLLLLVFVSLLIVVSMWIVFEKAGESGWKSLVPFYNMYVLMEISGKPGWWLFLLFIPFVGTVFYLLAMLAMSERFGRGAAFGVGLCFLPMIFFPLLAFGGGSQAEA